MSTTQETTAPPRTACPTDHVVLLDDLGRPSGTLSRGQVHHRATPLHLAFSCYVVRSDGAVLLTQRSTDKVTWPGVWTNACCGHPRLGETLQEAIQRRARDELGLELESIRFLLPDFAYRAQMDDDTVEHELCPVAIAVARGAVLADPGEVADFEWTTWGDLVGRAEADPASLSPWCVEQIRLIEDRWSVATVGSVPTSAGTVAGLDRPIRLGGSVDRTSAPVERVDPFIPVHDPLQALLSTFLTAKERELAVIDPRLTELTGAVGALVAAGGKRLRPAFVYWGHRATGAVHDPGVIHPAAAVELLHTFALLHDDVMDRSAQRRGVPTAHVALATTHRAEGRLGDPDWYGVSAAVLAGDLAFVWADELLDSAPLPERVLMEARAEFTRLRTEVTAGQHLDLRLCAESSAAETGAQRVALLKSARYTVTRPLLIGAALAGDAEPGLLDALRTYGDAVGTAFQMRDDVLGVFGDPSRTGKSTVDDLREGKRTVLALRALRLAGPSGRRLLQGALGDPNLTPERAARCADVIADSGALASVETLISSLRAEADEALEVLPEPATGALTTLADLSVDRAT